MVGWIAGPGTPGRSRRHVLADINGSNIAAGLTAGLWYAFAGISLHLKVAADLHLTPAATSSWFFIVCCTAGLSGIVLTLRYRQPLSIAATIPGWVFLAAAGDRYTLPELAGASLMAGVAIVALGLLGVGARLMRWLPLPIVMGMFAGSSLGSVTAVFQHLGAEPVTVG